MAISLLPLNSLKGRKINSVLDYKLLVHPQNGFQHLKGMVVQVDKTNADFFSQIPDLKFQSLFQMQAPVMEFHFASEYIFQVMCDS